MNSSLTALFQQNQALSLSDRKKLVALSNGVLIFDELLLDPEKLSENLILSLKNYGWLWLSLPNESGIGTSDILIHDYDSQHRQLAYLDFQGIESQNMVLSQLLTRIENITALEVLEYALIRSARKTFEGVAASTIMAGYPDRSYRQIQKEDPWPKGGYGLTKIYADFLHFSNFPTFSAYLYDLLESRANLPEEEKANYFEKLIKGFMTTQASLRIGENCVFTSRIMMLKLLGLWPLSFLIKKYHVIPSEFRMNELGRVEAKSLASNDSSYKLFGNDVPYRKLVMDELQLYPYDLAYIMSLTGTSDFLKGIYAKIVGLTENTRSNRYESIDRYINEKVLPFAKQASPKKQQSLVIERGKIAMKTRPEKWSELLLNMQQLDTLFPSMLEVQYNGELQHFVVLVYNPFNNKLIILDPLGATPDEIAAAAGDQQVLDNMLIRPEIALQDDDKETWNDLQKAFFKPFNGLYYQIKKQ